MTASNGDVAGQPSFGALVHRPQYDTSAKAMRCHDAAVQDQRENGDVAIGPPAAGVWSRHETRRERANVGSWHWPSECPHNGVRPTSPRATTPGDRDRGRELAAARVTAYLDAVTGWRPEAIEIDRHTTGEALLIADLRALAAPAETEAGDAHPCDVASAEVLDGLRQENASIVTDLNRALALASRWVHGGPNGQIGPGDQATREACARELMATLRLYGPPPVELAASPPAPEGEAAHPFDVLADTVEALPAMAPGVAMPIGGNVPTLVSWLRSTPCRNTIDRSAVPAALASQPAPGEGQGATEGGERRCSAFHPEFGFTCPFLPADHGGPAHFDPAGGWWDREHGQIRVYLAASPPAPEGEAGSGEQRCHHCGGLGPKSKIQAPHVPAGGGGWCDGDSDPTPPIPLSQLFPPAPASALAVGDLVQANRDHALDLVATAIARSTSGQSSDARASDALDDLHSAGIRLVVGWLPGERAEPSVARVEADSAGGER